MNEEVSGVLDGVLPESYLSLFDMVKDTMFWVKDHEFRFVRVNAYFAKYINLKESEIIGKTDYQLFPKEVASFYASDDLKIMEEGEGIYEKLELLINRLGEAEWRQTSKLPVHTAEGGIVGTIGISTAIDRSRDLIPVEYQTFTKVVDFARENLHEGVGVKELAAFLDISISTLNRKFQEYLYITPQKLLHQLKISRACELLESSMLNVSEISYRCGYDSPAAFSRAFKTAKGLSPLQYRK